MTSTADPSHSPIGETGTSDLAATRVALQAVAEHILSPARHAATGHIGLQATPGGFGTERFDQPGGGDRRLLVDGTELVVIDRDARGNTTAERREPLTTLRAAGALVGIEPGAPVDVYTPATALDLDAPLRIDPGHAARLADWFMLAHDALTRCGQRWSAGSAAAATATPAPVPTLWPEHFDVAISFGEINFGGSPGDADHPEPYLYVGPWSPPPRDGAFWNEAWGASTPADAISSVDDAVTFFMVGRDRATPP